MVILRKRDPIMSAYRQIVRSFGLLIIGPPLLIHSGTRSGLMSTGHNGTSFYTWKYMEHRVVYIFIELIPVWLRVCTVILRDSYTKTCVKLENKPDIFKVVIIWIIIIDSNNSYWNITSDRHLALSLSCLVYAGICSCSILVHGDYKIDRQNIICASARRVYIIGNLKPYLRKKNIGKVDG